MRHDRSRRMAIMTHASLTRQEVAHMVRRLTVLIALVLSAWIAAPAADAPEGQLTWGVHITLAPTWFDPAEMPELITPFMIMYALHEGMAKAMPDNPLAPMLAESWKASPDGRVYDF